MNFANATKISKEAILERKQMLDVAREEDAAIADNLTELSRIKQAENSKTREPNRIVGFFKRLFSFFSRRSASKRYTSGDMSTGSGKERMGGAYEEFLLAQLSFQTGGSTAYKDNAQASLQFSSRNNNGGANADISTAAIDRDMSRRGNRLNNSSTVVTYKDKLRLIDVTANFKMRGGFGQTTAEYKAKTATLKLMNEYRKLTVHGNGTGAFTLLHDYTSDTDKFGEVVSADIYYSNAEIETGNFFIRDGRQGPELMFGGANGSITVPDLFKANFFAAEANGTDITASDIMIYPLKNILSWKANESIPMDGNLVMNDNGLLIQTVPFELEDIEAMGGLFKAEQARFNMAVDESGDVGLESNLGKWKLGVSLENIASIEKTGENTDVEVTEDRRLRIPNNASEKYRLSLLGHDFELQATGADTFIEVGEKFLGLGFNPIDIAVGGLTIEQAQLNIGVGKGQAELGFSADAISKSEQGESVFPEGMQIANVKGKISEKGVQVESAEMSYTGEIGGVSIGDMRAGITNLIINNDGVYFDKIAATVNDMAIGSYASVTEAGVSLTKAKEDKSVSINVLFGGLDLNIEDKIPYVDISAEGIKGDISIKEGDSSVSVDDGSISVSVKDFVTLTLNDFAYANGTFSAETVRADILNGGKFESELFCVDSVSLATTKLAINKNGLSVADGGKISAELEGVKLAGIDISNINADVDPANWNVKAQAELKDVGYDFDFASLKFSGVIGVDYTNGALTAVVDDISASIDTDYFTLSVSEISKTSGKDLQFGSVVVSTSKLLGDKAITANVKDLVLSRYASNISFGSIVVNYNSNINIFGAVIIETPQVEIAENFSGFIAGGKVCLDTPLLEAGGDFEVSFLKDNSYFPSVTKAENLSVEIKNVAKIDNIEVTSVQDELRIKFSNIALDKKFGSGFSLSAESLGGTFHLSKKDKVRLTDVSGSINASYQDFFSLSLSDIANDDKGIYAGNINATLAKTDFFGGIIKIAGVEVNAKNIGISSRGLYVGEGASFDALIKGMNIAGCEISAVTAAIGPEGAFEAGINFAEQGSEVKLSDGFSFVFTGAAQFGYDNGTLSIDLSKTGIGFKTQMMEMTAAGISAEVGGFGIEKLDVSIKNIPGLDGAVAAQAKSLLLTRDKLGFESITVSYSDKISLFDGMITVDKPVVDIQNNFERIEASGNIGFTTKVLNAGGDIKVAYDRSKTMPELVSAKNVSLGIDKVGTLSIGEMLTENDAKTLRFNDIALEGFSHDGDGEGRSLFERMCSTIREGMSATLATATYDKTNGLQYNFDDIQFKIKQYKIPFGEKGEAIINVQDKILHLDYAISLPNDHKFPADAKNWQVPRLIELGADYPIIPGAVSVGGSLFAGAAMNATAALDMKLDTTEKSVVGNAAAELKAIAGVGANAKLTIGVPGLASLVLGLEGTLAGMITDSRIQANVGVQMLNGRPDIMKEKTDFSYDLNFKMKSYLKAFVNAKALFVLDKQLYSADIANIDLCSAALSGSAGFGVDGKWRLNDDRVFDFNLGEQLKDVLNIHSAGERLDKARNLNNKMKEYQAMIGFDVWGSEKAFYTASKLQGDIMSQLSSISELSEYAIKRLASIDKKSIDAEKEQDRSRADIENKALILERVAKLNSGNDMSEADLRMAATIDILLQKKAEKNTLKSSDVTSVISSLHDVEPIKVMAYISKRWGLNVKSGSSEGGRLGEDDVIKYQNDYVVLRKTLKSIYDRPINYEKEHLESLYETAVNSSKKVISDSRLNNQTFMEKSSATLKDIKLKNEEYIKITDQIVAAEKKINEYAEKEKNASAKEMELMNDEASASANQSKIAEQRKKVGKYVLKLDEYKKKKNKLVETQSAISTSLNVIKLQFVNNTDTQKLVENIGLSANEFRDKRKAMSDQRDKLIDYNKVIRHNEAAIDLSGIHSPENSKTKYDLNPLRAMVNEMGSSSYNDSYKKVIEDFISANTTSVSYDQYKDISDKLLSKNREKNTARYTRLLTHRLVTADKRNQTDFVEDKLLRRMLGENFTKDVSSEKKGQELIDALSFDMVSKMNTSSSDIEERQNHIRALEDIIIQAAEANSTAISTLYKLNEISPQSFAVDYDPYQENSSTVGVKNSISTLAKGEEFEDGEYASMINRLHNEAKTITNEIKQ